jgi:hypothetical protein
MTATSKARVLGAVPLTKWLFIYASRSGRQAEDFIRQISAVRSLARLMTLTARLL